MGLETGDFIANLNNLWPLEDDPTHEGNEHLQLIKNVLQQSFKGNDGAGNPENGWDSGTDVNPEELDHMIGVTWPVKDTQDLIKNVSGTIAVGQDDDTLPMKLHTSGVNGAVQQWDDGESQVATVMNSVNVLDYLYPVNRGVMHTLDNVNPGTWLAGTTWEQIAQGRFIVGVGTGDDGTNTKQFNAGDDTDGEYLHKLTEDEMPIHTHLEEQVSNVEVGFGTGKNIQANALNNQCGPAGGDQPHNNVPPSYGLYVWKRTA